MKNSDIVFLNLPPVPKSIQDASIELLDRTNYSQSRYNRISSLYPASYTNIAAQEYDTECVPDIPRPMLEEIRDLYGKFFIGGIRIGLGVAVNLSGANSMTPPHCDRVRRTAINYLLRSGGDNVVTTIYNESRKNHDLSAGENLNYDQVTVSSQTIIPNKTWHTFNPQRFHSVENIVDRRYYFSLFLNYNLSFEDFLKDYHSLVIF